MPVYEFPAGGPELPPVKDMIAELRRLGLPADTVRITPEGGAIELEGTVPDGDSHERLLLALGNLPGVARIDDRLKQARHASLLDAFAGLSHLPAGASSERAAGAQLHEADPTRYHADPIGPAGSSLHVVQPGETLDAIAIRHFGDATGMMRILEANRGLMGENTLSPDPGRVLRIPQR